MSQTIHKLNQYLIDLNVLYRKVQNYHWNVVGRGFFQIHSRLETYYNGLNGQIDDVAERILTIGGQPAGTLQDYLQHTTIVEAKNEKISCNDAILNVKKDFEAMLIQARSIKDVAESEGDSGSAALVDEYIAQYEKELWMLNAFLTEI